MFRRHRDQYVARFAADEVAVLRQVASEVIGLLTDNFDRDDPVVERLFPDVYADDPAEAAEFRRYTEGALKEAEVDRAGAVHAPRAPAGTTLTRRAVSPRARSARTTRSGSSRWTTPSVPPPSTGSIRPSSCGCGRRWTTATRNRSSSTTRTPRPRRTRRGPTSRSP